MDVQRKLTLVAQTPEIKENILSPKIVAGIEVGWFCSLIPFLDKIKELKIYCEKTNQFLDLIVFNYEISEEFKEVLHFTNRRNIHWTIFVESFYPLFFSQPQNLIEFLSRNGHNFSLLVKANNLNSFELKFLKETTERYSTLKLIVPFFSFPFTPYEILRARQVLTLPNVRRTIFFENVFALCTYFRNLRIAVDEKGYLCFCHFLFGNKENRITKIKNLDIRAILEINKKIRERFNEIKIKELKNQIVRSKYFSPCIYCYKKIVCEGVINEIYP